jgi:hypothetical protein
MAVKFDTEEQLAKWLRDNKILENPEFEEPQEERPRRTRKKEKFMSKSVGIPMWLLFSFIGFGIVGVCFTGYQASLHWKEILIVVAMIFAVLFVSWLPDRKKRSRRLL